MLKTLIAIIYATYQHRGQKRRISNNPYIYHPLAAGYTLYKCGYSYDVVIAGILHDVLEDCGVSAKKMSKIFGGRITMLVRTVTNTDENYQSAPEHMSIATLSIKTADTISNVSDYMKYDGGVSDSKLYSYYHFLNEAYPILKGYRTGPSMRLARKAYNTAKALNMSSRRYLRRI